MIPSVEAPGEKLIIRLWETVDKGLGGLLAPWQTRRLGRAETDVQRERRVALAKAEQDVAAIRSGREYPTLDSPLLTAAAPRERTATHDEAFPHTLATIAHRNLLLERMQAEVNVAKVLLLAEAALQDDVQEPPNRTADDDWLFRWRDSASKVSSEDLRGLWARVLAGEIKSPGSFSLRTLEFLKNLSQAEARSIQQLAPFVLDNDFVCNADDELLQSQGITLGFLIKLQGLGIVTQTSPSLRKIRSCINLLLRSNLVDRISLSPRSGRHVLGRAVVQLGELRYPVDRPRVLRETGCDCWGRLERTVPRHPVVVQHRERHRVHVLLKALGVAQCLPVIPGVPLAQRQVDALYDVGLKAVVGDPARSPGRPIVLTALDPVSGVA